ncbi:TetR/AcrR family transcriptional regulator [Streptomyces sp. NPDC088400]|uniref:TetR/AcrR family transcriptional regulator n=1 Tax=Streptomyces sp. NPDC088400 TaxID=3365861 RepID=UPI0037FCD331
MAATSRIRSDEQPAQLGLRERKKLKTRIAIRGAAYRLISEQGYEATTVEQIAEAAEVSPSTVFRYFPAKEDMVVTDEYDPLLAGLLRARPAGEAPLESFRLIVVETLRNALATERDEMVLRAKLLVEVPAVRARMTEALSVSARPLSGVLAERTGRDPAGLEFRIFVAAAFAALREVTIYWGERGCRDDLIDLADSALAGLEGGRQLCQFTS